MVRWEAAWARAVQAQHPFVSGKRPADFRPLVYTQQFAALAAGSTSGSSLQTFPAGAFVLGIDGSAICPKVMKPDQYYADGGTAPLDSTFDRIPSCTPGNKDLFSVNLTYTQNEVLTPNGPCNAAALFGVGDATQFPVREIIVDPSQGLLCQARNDLSFQLVSGAAAATGILLSLVITVAYHCMVPRAIG